MPVKECEFGRFPDGSPASLFRLTNSSTTTAAVTNYGAILVSLQTVDRDGRSGEITLGFDSLDGYLGDHPYFGATVGRFANRIAGGQFELDGTTYRLATNDGDNHLHGGVRGFDRKVWQSEILEDDDCCGVRFSRLSQDGEENYPGNLNVTVTYALTQDNELRIEFEAVTDQATPINLTNHSYFNLGSSETVLDHIVRLNASHYTPVNDALIPTGEIAPVAGTPMDFTTAKPVGQDIGQTPEGYDHNFVLDKESGQLATAAHIEEPESGRTLEILTTEPAAQFYTGNFLDGTLVGRGGVTYSRHAGFCVEPQKFPDSPNQPDFPNCILRPNDVYRHTIVYRFGTV